MGRPVFIANPVAGNGRGAEAIKRIRRSVGGAADIVLTHGPGEAETLAMAHAAEGFAPVVAVGGDGTIQEVARGLLQVADPPPLGIVAAGSSNDAVRTLGLPRDPLSAARMAWSDTAGAIDVGRCNGAPFLNVAGVGLDTVVVAAVNARSGRWARGRVGYIGQALRELRRFENPSFTIRLDDEVIETPSVLLAVANLRYYGGGMKIAPDADPTDGLLDVWLGGDLSRAEVLALMPAIFLGQHGRHSRVKHYRAARVRVESPYPQQVQMDGELLAALPADFDVDPLAIRIMGWAGR